MLSNDMIFWEQFNDTNFQLIDNVFKTEFIQADKYKIIIDQDILLCLAGLF